MRQPTDPASAFTLVELLVVISVIAVLLALLAPSLEKAIAAAEAAVCGSNQRNMHQAFYWYQEDYRRTWIAPWDFNNLQGTNGSGLPIPPSGAGSTLGSWQYQWPYVMAWYAMPGKGKAPIPPGGSSNPNITTPRSAGIMYCPTLLAGGRTWFNGSKITTWAYGMIAPPYNLLGYPKVARFTHPSETVHLQDLAWVSPGNGVKQEPMPNGWANNNSIPTDPHLGKSSYVFADGHVERLSGRWTELEDASVRDNGESELRWDAYQAY